MKTPLPAIEFHPRSNRVRVLDVGSALAFESAAFNARWRIIATDLVYAHAVVHPRLMERLLAAGHNEAPITIDGASIYTWSTSKREAHRRFERSLDLLSDVVESIPPHVIREYGTGRKASGKPIASLVLPDVESTSAFAVRGREKNRLARLSLTLAATIFGAPAAVVVGHMSLRAVKRGEANNPRTARAGLILGYILSPLAIAAMIAGFLENPN
jgi:hypothetical protein